MEGENKYGKMFSMHKFPYNILLLVANGHQTA
jgi:hypothetical protein